MHETLVKIKDVEFVSYLRPSVHHQQKAVLQMSFRLPHMQEDEMIIDIQKDHENRLYATKIDYYCERDGEQFSLEQQFDQDELHELLKAVLNSDVTQKELTHYQMNDYIDCYAKVISKDFDVIVRHVHLESSTNETPLNEEHTFDSKLEALRFFYTLVDSYEKHAVEMSKQSFGAYKFVWKKPNNDGEILTYIMFQYQGNEIRTVDDYNVL